MDIINLLHTINNFNWLEMLGAASTIVVGLIALFEVIPGDQPEKTLRAVVEALAKISRK